jgi:hypothetical protein
VAFFAEPMDESGIMTPPLRRAHRYVWIALGGILPALVAAGLALRPPQAPEERLADRITLLLPNGTEMVADTRELWGSAVDAPDPLAYWSETSAKSLAGAKPIGSLARSRRSALALPAKGGYLLLYSLAHGEVLASAPVPKEMP